MVLTASTSLPLGSQAPDFTLPDTVTGKKFSLRDLPGAKGLLLLFICNHCPYVKLIQTELSAIGRDYMPRGIAMAAISANDVSTHPADGPEEMKKEAERHAYPFPYLYDESQEVAKAYQAACTPDIFLFDADRKLVYHGQLDDARPNKQIPVTGADLRRALDALLAGEQISEGQTASVGCNIKWKKGNEPDYFKKSRIATKS